MLEFTRGACEQNRPDAAVAGADASSAILKKYGQISCRAANLEDRRRACAHPCRHSRQIVRSRLANRNPCGEAASSSRWRSIAPSPSS